MTLTSTDRRIGVQLNYGIAFLRQVGIEEFQTDARILLEYCTGMSRTQMILALDREISSECCDLYHRWLRRRSLGEPIAYIVGEREFWSLCFAVSPAVLIPRPETEFLLDRVLALAEPANLNSGILLDLCCGSGVIATVLAKETGQFVIGTDISAAALAVASKNVVEFGTSLQVQLMQADLLSCFASDSFSLVVSNPPYVSSVDIATCVAREVRDFEPHLALDGGDDGLDIIKKIYVDLPRVMRPGGQIFMEIGADQGAAVSALFRSTIKGVRWFNNVTILQDYAGRDRVLTAKLID